MSNLFDGIATFSEENLNKMIEDFQKMSKEKEEEKKALQKHFDNIIKRKPMSEVDSDMSNDEKWDEFRKNMKETWQYHLDNWYAGQERYDSERIVKLIRRIDYLESRIKELELSSDSEESYACPPVDEDFEKDVLTREYSVVWDDKFRYSLTHKPTNITVSSLRTDDVANDYCEEYTNVLKYLRHCVRSGKYENGSNIDMDYTYKEMEKKDARMEKE